MTTLREAAQQAIALICSARLCEVNSMSSRQEMLRLLIEATDLLRAALAQQAEPNAEYERGFIDGMQKQSQSSVDRAVNRMAQQAEPKTCTWQQDGDSDSSLYATSCRHYFNLDDGTPEDNEMHWCCYCGKRLVQELLTEEDDDERS